MWEQDFEPIEYPETLDDLCIEPIYCSEGQYNSETGICADDDLNQMVVIVSVFH